jgi:peroxiredoxin
MPRNAVQRSQSPVTATILRRGGTRRRITVLAAGSVLLVGVFLALVLRPAGSAQLAAAGPVVGRPVADFTLPDLSGRATSLHRFLGRPLLLQFWAVDCPSCTDERPALVRAAAPFLAHGGLAIGVDSYMESAAMVRGYLADHQEPYTTILIDSNGRVVYGQFHVIGVPTSLFIDRKGIVRKIVTGEMAEKDIRAALDRISA